MSILAIIGLVILVVVFLTIVTRGAFLEILFDILGAVIGGGGGGSSGGSSGGSGFGGGSSGGGGSSSDW